MGTEAPHLLVEASAPQLIRIGGLVDVLQHNDLDEATCEFGDTGDDANVVRCACDAARGSVECEVPPSHGMSMDGVALHVRAKIADFTSPVMYLKYQVQQAGFCGTEDRAAVLYGAADAAEDFEEDLRKDSLQARVLRWVTFGASGRGAEGVGSGRSARRFSLLHQCIAEAFGVMFIVIFGVGSVCSAVLFGSLQGLWQVAVVWGFGVALAIAATASISGAHLNPAVSLAFAMFRPADFPWSKLLPFWIAQYLGGIIGGAFNYALYGSQFAHFEAANGIVRGTPESVATAMAFGEYFPNPGFADVTADNVVSPLFAMFVEAWGTGVLMFIILALTDPNQKLIRNKEMLPLYIGFTVAVLISLYAPITQAGWNPARDFGPRVVAALAGWGRVAIPGPRNGFWVYIVGPKLGAPVGAWVYDLMLKRGIKND